MSISFKITPQVSSLPLGTSYFWDAPQLPEPSNYPVVDNGNDNPYPMTFIAQINCADIAFLDTECLLPKSGLLYFFGDIDYFLNDTAIAANGIGLWDKGITVLYSDAPVNSLSRYNPFEEKNTIVPHTITFVSGTERNDGHKLLGSPYDEEVQSAFTNKWRLLFQLDSDESDFFNLQFYDMGILYFMIESDKLKNKDFSRVQAYMTSL